MITALTIKQPKNKKLLNRIVSSVYTKPPTYELKYIDEMKINNIIYEGINKKIPWKKIRLLLGDSVDQIVCSENIKLPIEYGFRRFNFPKLMRKLCENASLVSLKKANINPSKLKIALYDPRAAYCYMAERLICFSSQLKIITNRIEAYEDEVNRLMEERGVSIILDNKVDRASKCNVIVSPDKIKVPMKTRYSTVIFTGEKPAIPLKGFVYDSYKVNVPDKYKDAKPEDLSDEYFMSVLYENPKFFGFGNLVPKFCLSSENAYSFEEISKNIVKSIKQHA